MPILRSQLIIRPNEEKNVVVTDLQDCEFVIQANSKLIFVALLPKGFPEKRKLCFNFQGSHSELTCIILTIGTNDDQFDLETVSDHGVSNTKAHYYLRSLLFDQSRVNYEGKLLIKKGGTQTDTYLAHHSLLLSPNAKVRTIPSLEIEANEVKAGHAATIGRVDDEMLFYLESRGIEKKEAIRLLIKSFVEIDLKKIPNEEVKNMVLRALEKLEGSRKF